MEYNETDCNEIPLKLLLEADPSESSISSYLDDSWCYSVSDDDGILGICVAKLTKPNTAEICNISIYPKHQARGLGSNLLKFALSQLTKKDIERVELSTGTFGYQLAYYQRLGFRVDSVIKDHFLLNYSEPIFENGIQLKDSLRLYIQLQ